MQLQFKKGQVIAIAFLLLFAGYIKIKSMGFEDKYQEYINGTKEVFASSPSIFVEYQFKDNLGQIQTNYYVVPSLYHTPEWREIELLIAGFWLLIPWAAPLPSKKKDIYTKV